MKKLLLGLGTLAAVAAPVAAVVACGSNDASFGEADKTTQAPALAALATEVQKIDFLTSYPNLTKTEVKGDDVRYTFSDTAADSSSDDTAVATVTTVRLTLSLTDKKVTLIERSTNGKDFTKAALADNFELTTAEEAAIKTATTTAKEAIDKAVEDAKPAQAAGGMDAALKATKDLDTKTINADTVLSDDQKTALISKINAAASIADLTTIMMTDYPAAKTDATGAGTGAITGTGTGTGTSTTLSDAAKLVDGFEVEVRADQTDAKVQTLAKASDETAADIKKLFEGATEVGEVTFQTEAAGKLEHKREVHYFNVADEDKALLTKLAAFIGSTENDFKADGTLKTQYIPLSPSVEPTDAMKSADFQITIFDWNDVPGIKASFSLHSASTASTTEMISGIAFEKK